MIAPTAEQTPVTTVLCIGNTLMGDDGLGAVVAHELRQRGLEDVRIVERPNAEMGLIRYFFDSNRIFVVDAIDVGLEPGAAFRFSPDEAGVTQLRSHNIHGMGVSYLVTNARMAGYSPDVTIYAVQVGDVRPNPDTLTDQVLAAAYHVADLVEADAAGIAASNL